MQRKVLEIHYRSKAGSVRGAVDFWAPTVRSTILHTLHSNRTLRSSLLVIGTVACLYRTLMRLGSLHQMLFGILPLSSTGAMLSMSEIPRNQPKEYLDGFPSFAAYIATDKDLVIYRRFDRLSARNLLYF